MRIALTLALLMFAANAAAADTFRFDRGVVSTGSSANEVQQKAGRMPDRIVTLENSRGAAVGERWEYYLRDKQVNFTIQGGRVTRIEELR